MIHPKGMFGLGKQPAFPNHTILFINLRERILHEHVSSFQAMGRKGNFPNRYGFYRKRPKLDFFCFHRVTKAHKIIHKAWFPFGLFVPFIARLGFSCPFCFFQFRCPLLFLLLFVAFCYFSLLSAARRCSFWLFIALDINHPP